MSTEPHSYPHSSLNEAQQRYLRISCQYMDGLLRSIEEVLNPARLNSVFPKYIYDITPVQRKTIEDTLARIRARLLCVLECQAIELEKPRISALHAIHTSLTFVEIATEELSPGRMRGYGPVSETGAADLNTIMRDLQSIVQQLDVYVLQRGVLVLLDRLKDVG
jgi:hypothetical protein